MNTVYPLHSRPYVLALLFGIMLMLVSTPAIYFFDFYAGTATRGFGVPPTSPVRGIGMFYLYMSSYYTTLLVLLPLFLSKQFGTASIVFVPYVIIGFPVNYHYEWTIEHIWQQPYSGLGWSAAFLLTGLSADITFWYLPDHITGAARAVATGIVMGLASFFCTVAALNLVYTATIDKSYGSFLGVAYFALPWMILNSAFGGYTAYAVSQGGNRVQ